MASVVLISHRFPYTAKRDLGVDDTAKGLSKQLFGDAFVSVQYGRQLFGRHDEYVVYMQRLSPYILCNVVMQRK